MEICALGNVLFIGHMCTWECSRAVYTMGLGSIPAMTAT